MATIRLVGPSLHVDVPFAGDNLIRARNIPQRRWLKAAKVWSCRPSLANMEYLAKTWPDAQWLDGAAELFQKALKGGEQRAIVAAVNEGGAFDMSTIEKEIALGLFRTPHPWEHQRKALKLGRDLDEFAYIMDQGTGKTRVVCDDSAHNYRRGRVNALFVLAPNSVKTNWVADDPNPEEPDAIDRWMPHDINVIKGVWVSDPNKTQRIAWEEFMDRAVVDREDGIAILAANYESVNMDRSFNIFEEFMKRRQTMIAADESTRLGSTGSNRTRNSKFLRKLAVKARILSGTPIIKSPLKGYSQFGFLNEDIMGFGSFYSYKARYAVMGGYQGRQVLMFQNLEELSEKIASCSYRVKKEECLDLPPKIYKKRRVYMTSEQARVYNEMKDTMLATIDGKTIQATILLTQIMKLQQITGGYVKPDDDGPVIEIMKPEHNPLIKETLAILDEAGDQSVVVWAHFKEEIKALVTAIRKAGYTVGEFHGGVKESERMGVRRDFKNKKFQVLVGNQAAGGIGIDEFKVASVVVYYSNDYDTEARVQSEDRTHRGGSEIHEKITYWDLIVPATVRVKIIQTLRKNKEISDEVMRDGIREWI